MINYMFLQHATEHTLQTLYYAWQIKEDRALRCAAGSYIKRFAWNGVVLKGQRNTDFKEQQESQENNHAALVLTWWRREEVVVEIYAFTQNQRTNVVWFNWQRATAGWHHLDSDRSFGLSTDLTILIPQNNRQQEN